MCSARKFADGRMVAYNYGRVTSLATDPVEKKPLYHFRPGTEIFSVGGLGCNLSCRYCQNWPITTSFSGKKRATFKGPEELVSMCREQGLDAIAFTYNEPSIWLEYVEDVAAVDRDLAIVLVTNGSFSPEVAKDACRYTRAMNIDVKSFSDGFYKTICGGDLDTVKATCETVFGEGTHLELTYLVIPGYNDEPAEISKFVEWVRDSLSPDVPVHFTRFHPDYQMEYVPMTPPETLDRCLEISENLGLNYPYVGNIMMADGSDTYCPECGAVLVRRTGYRVEIVGLSGNRCSCCKARVNFRWRSPRCARLRIPPSGTPRTGTGGTPGPTSRSRPCSNPPDPYRGYLLPGP